MATFEIGAFEFEIAVDRKVGTACDGDLRAGRAQVVYKALDKVGRKTDYTIDAKGPAKPAIPPKPEKAISKENNFVERVGLLEGWTPISFVTPAGEKPKWGGAPQGYGLFHPGVRYRDNPGVYHTDIEFWQATKFRKFGQRNLESLKLEFTGPFYCWCKKTNDYLVKLIRLTVTFDGTSHPVIKMEESEAKAVATPFESLTSFKKVEMSPWEPKKRLGKTNWRYREVSGIVLNDCPCKEAKPEEKPKDGEKSEAAGKEESAGKGGKEDTGSFATNVPAQPCVATIHVSYVYNDPAKAKKAKKKGKSKKGK